MFAARNLTDDAELEELVGKAKAVMNGKSVKELRTNDGYREEVRKEMTRVTEALDGLLEDAPGRRITFEEEV